jgi:integrase/recombinase XerD
MSNIEETLRDFTTYLYSEKGLAQASIEAYQRDVTSFHNFLKNKKIEDISSLEGEEIIAYLSTLYEKGYASSSLARATFALKVFFRFLIKEKKSSSKILLFLENPKVWQLIPEVLTIEEIEILLKIPKKETFVGGRDRAIMEVLYSSGLRVSELCSLNINDIDDIYVKVLGKGGKERIVPIGKKAIEAIDYYLVAFRDKFESHKDKALFLTHLGKRIDRITVWKRIKEYVKESKIPKKVSPHTFRHSYATHLLDGGADLRIIQELLGHATISSTERYTHVSHTQLKEAFSRYHPRK